MKKNIIFILFIALVFSACTQSYVEKANEDYDYNAIIPGKINIKGTGTAYTDGTLGFDYVVDAIRDGSVYSWKVEGYSASIAFNREGTARATITFEKPTDDVDDVMIIVQETTVSGKTGEPDTAYVDVKLFCPLPNGINDLVGTVVGVDENEGYWYGSAVQEYVIEDNGGYLNVSGFFYTMLNAWGTLTDGGTCDITFSPNSPGLTIAHQYYATNDEGAPWVYNIEGEGLYANCGTAPIIHLYYDIEWVDPDDGSAGWMFGGDKPLYAIHAIIDYSTKKVISVSPIKELNINPDFILRKNKK